MNELTTAYLCSSLSALPLIAAALVLRWLMRAAPRWAICLVWIPAGIRLLLPFSPGSPLGILPPLTLSTLPLAPILFISAALVLAGLMASLRLNRAAASAQRLRPGILQGEAIPTPFIRGIFAPTILLPARLTQEQLPPILAHEQAHLERMDHLWKPLCWLILALHWFNPAVWLAYALFCRDMELACDEKAALPLSPTQRANYARVLLECSLPAASPPGFPPAFGQNAVKSRVKALLTDKKPSALAAVVLIVLIIAAGLLLAPPLQPISQAELDQALSEIILERNAYRGQSETFAAESHTILGKSANGDTLTLYCMVYAAEYSPQSVKEGRSESGSHCPTIISLRQTADGWQPEEYWTPRDGSYYAKDIRARFPFWLWLRTDTQLTINDHQADALAKARAHFGIGLTEE